MSDPRYFSWPSPGQGVTCDEVVSRWLAGSCPAVQGAPGSGFAALLAQLQFRAARPVVVITGTPAAAVALKRDLRYLACTSDTQNDVISFAPYEMGPWDELIPDRQSSMRRTRALFRLAAGALPWRFAVFSAEELLQRVVHPDRLAENCLRIVPGDFLERDTFAAFLDRCGYRAAPLVEEQGNCAVRGFLVDVFVPGTEWPVRIEFFGDTVESIRSFSSETQETISALSEAWIHPTRQHVIPQSDAEKQRISDRIREICDAVNLPTSKAALLIDDVLAGRMFVGSHGYQPAFERELGTLFDYLPSNVIVALDDPGALRSIWRRQQAVLEGEYARRVEKALPAFSCTELLMTAGEIEHRLADLPTISLHSFEMASIEEDTDPPLDTAPDLNGRDFFHFGQRLKKLAAGGETYDVMEPLKDALQDLLQLGYRVVLVSHTRGHGDRLMQLLRSHEIECTPLQGKATDSPPGLYLDIGELSRGNLIPGDGVCFITEEEVFGERTRATRRHGPGAGSLADLRMLQSGDLVVHREHGIGKYMGLVRQTVRGVQMDFLLICYRNDDRLYLPVYRLSAIQKYQSASESAAPLDKLGGQTFSTARTAARRRAMEMAAQLLDLYARRSLATRPPVIEADDMYREFEAGFPFEETPDQLRAIEEVMGDLEAERPMDRLVCGDVGFGKTEVAMRAAFRVITSGLQVAVLVPTTILAQQHYESIRRRFAAWPITVRMLSRFRTNTENASVVSSLKAGTCDIVVGTHRLLSADVHFQRLGLLVIDEEHRFGVGHKERIRALKASVDTLAMTATPIPRTLHMSFLRLRDMSLISTPPVNRIPIRTMICHDDDQLIRTAIERELGREGQVYFLHNRVRGIQMVADRIRRLVPSARVVVGHGQMKEDALESVMIDFISGHADVLVCTSIIESGLDIPRANTIFIDRADAMGLAQLYQIRGRVGRSDIQAFSYLIVPPLELLSTDARRRVEALTRHTELGSGFSLASLDLEIRGAGNLLGAEQSGDVSLVGFEMFMELLEEATEVLQGRMPIPRLEPEITLDNPGFIDDFYIPEMGLRLQYYKRLSCAEDEEEVREISAELVDRFGSLPTDALTLIDGMTARALCRKLGIAGLEAGATKVVLHIDDNTRLDPGRLVEMVRKGEGAIRFSPDRKLTMAFEEGGLSGAEGAIRFLRALSAYAIQSA